MLALSAHAELQAARERRERVLGPLLAARDAALAAFTTDPSYCVTMAQVATSLASRTRLTAA